MLQKRYCQNCGAEQDRDDRFCPECGVELGPVAEQAAAYSAGGPYVPPGGRKTTHMGVLVIAALLVCCVVTGLAWWQLAGKESKNSGAAAANTAEQAANATTAPQSDKVAPNADEKATGEKSKLSDPRTYLPQANMKYTVFRNYADGDKGTVEFITAKISDSALVSAVEIVQNQGSPPVGFVEHFLSRQGVIYTVADNYMDELTIWLKNDLYEGMSWEQYGIKVKVSRIGVPCDVGFRIWQDCLKLEVNNTAVGVQHEEYYAPGYGLVLQKDPRSGLQTYTVRSIVSVDAKQAEEAVKRYAPNSGLLKK